MTSQHATGSERSTCIGNHLQRDIHFSPAFVALPVALSNVTGFLASGFWGGIADRHGHRWAMIIPALIGLFIVPFYLLIRDDTLTVIAFTIQGFFLGGMYEPSGFVIPMLVTQFGGAFVFVVALVLGPETKGKTMTAELQDGPIPAVLN